MTDRSKADLMLSVLEDLSVVSVGEEAIAEDQEVVENAIQSVYENLVDENLMIFDHSATRVSDVIPARIYHALVDLVSDRIGAKYGVPRGQVGQDGMTDKQRSAMKSLRRSILSADNDLPNAACYF